MNFKHQCVMKYIAFRFVPAFLIVGTLFAMPVYMLTAETGSKSSELTIAIALFAFAMAVLLAYYGINIFNFLSMIKQQEKQYNILFDHEKSEAFTKYSLGIFCSRNWFIHPGKIAIYRKAIQSASIVEKYDKGMIYSLRIKTHSGKSFIIKFRNEKDAKLLRKWARQYTP